jgi:transcription antitermination factor NusG
MWCAAQVVNNQHSVAIRHLERQNYKTFNPCYETRTIIRHKITIVCRPLFGNYLFIDLDDGQRWVPIRNTTGVSKLLLRQPQGSEYLQPAPIASEFIEGLRVCSRHADGDPEPTWRLSPGTLVRITAGPFRDHEAEILTWSDSDRVRLVGWLLGRSVVIEVRPGDLIEA